MSVTKLGPGQQPAQPVEERLALATFIMGVATFAVGLVVVVGHFFAGGLILSFATILIVIALRVEDISFRFGDYFQMKSRNRPRG